MCISTNFFNQFQIILEQCLTQTKGFIDAQYRNRPNPKPDIAFSVEKKPHKLQLFCKQLNGMHPGKIRKIMKQNSIFCKMCLGLGHDTLTCEVMKERKLKKCRKETSK